MNLEQQLLGSSDLYELSGLIENRIKKCCHTEEVVFLRLEPRPVSNGSMVMQLIPLPLGYFSGDTLTRPKTTLPMEESFICQLGHDPANPFKILFYKQKQQDYFPWKPDDKILVVTIQLCGLIFGYLCSYCPQTIALSKHQQAILLKLQLAATDILLFMDPLTGQLTRAYLYSYLNKLQTQYQYTKNAQANKHNKTSTSGESGSSPTPQTLDGTENSDALTILFFDVDNFKRYNDFYNYQVGDEVICGVAEAAEQSLRRLIGSDVKGKGLNQGPIHLFRLGGDEFIITIEGRYFSKEASGDSRLKQEKDFARQVLDDLLRFNYMIQYHDKKIRPDPPISISMGIARGEPIDGTLHRANRAEQVAKSGRKGTIVHYQEIQKLLPPDPEYSPYRIIEVLNDDEIWVNIGYEDHVSEGMGFEVLYQIKTAHNYLTENQSLPDLKFRPIKGAITLTRVYESCSVARVSSLGRYGAILPGDRVQLKS